jgi:hypothetical protein
MKYQIKLASLEKRLPDSFELPKSFSALVEECRTAQRGDLGWFAIKYSSPKPLLGFDPEGALVPFLALPDGGLVAFWFGPKRTVAIAAIGHDGDPKIVGATWADFLYRWSAKKTRIPDLDDRELRDFPKIRGVSKRTTALQSKQREFKNWLKKRERKKPGVDVEASERIRKKLYRLVKKHISMLTSDYGRCELSVTCTSRSYKVDWYCFPPKPFLDADRLKPVMQELVQLLGRSLKKSEVTVINDGCIFVERNICLGDPKLYADIE